MLVSYLIPTVPLLFDEFAKNVVKNPQQFNKIFLCILVFFYIHFLSESHTNKHTFEKAWFGLVQCLGSVHRKNTQRKTIYSPLGTHHYGSLLTNNFTVVEFYPLM